MSHLISHLVPHLAHPNRPSWLRNQVFGCHLNPDDLITPQDIQARMALHPYANLCNFNYYRPWIAAHTAGDTGSTVAYDKDRFKVDLDVQQFAPNEVTVKIVGDNVIMVEGKHEEKEDEHGFVYRHFVRKYVLPKGYSIDHVESLLSSDGVLTITAPKVEKAEDQHRHVPIKHTGQPSRPAVADPKKGAVKNTAK